MKPLLGGSVRIMFDPSMASGCTVPAYCHDVYWGPESSLGAFLAVVHGCGGAGSASLTEAVSPFLNRLTTSLLS